MYCYPETKSKVRPKKNTHCPESVPLVWRLAPITTQVIGKNFYLSFSDPIMSLEEVASSLLPVWRNPLSLLHFSPNCQGIQETSLTIDDNPTTNVPYMHSTHTLSQKP